MEEAKKIIQTRKIHLETLSMELYKLSPEKLRNLTKQDVELYRDLYGDGGVAYELFNRINVDTGLD